MVDLRGLRVLCATSSGSYIPNGEADRPSQPPDSTCVGLPRSLHLPRRKSMSTEMNRRAETRTSLAGRALCLPVLKDQASRAF
jgi:hypothetical protein